jgi:hypothetical protein
MLRMHLLIMSKVSTSPGSDRSVESTWNSQVYVPKLLVLLNEVFNSTRLRKTWLECMVFLVCGVSDHQFLVLCRDQDLLMRIGTATALEVRATGIQYTFAPCIAVCRNPRWGRCYESYSEDPSVVSNMTTIIDGLQGKAPANWTGPYLGSRSGNFFLLKLRVICKASCRDCMVNRSVNSHHVSK